MATRVKAKSRAWKNVDHWSADAEWSGTAMVYTASGNTSWALSGDYEVSYQDESYPEDMRASRLFAASRGERVRDVPYDKLGDELVVVFGAKMTAAKAIKTLKALTARIEDEGLMIGRVGHGDFVHEHASRTLNVDDAKFFDTDD
jgi:hypothetical protein